MYNCRSHTPSILVCFIFRGNSYGVRLLQDSTLEFVKDLIISKWKKLQSTQWDLSYVKEKRKRNVESDFDLQALLCHCVFNKLDSIPINIDVKAMSSSISNTSTSISSNCTEDVSSEIVSSDEDSNGLLNILRMDRNSPVDIFTGVGQCFNNVKDFRNKLILYQLVNGYKLNYIKNEKKRVTAKCAQPKCKFRIHASSPITNPNTMIIKTMNKVHTCGAGVFDVNNPHISSRFVKELVMNYIRSNPSMKTRDVINQCNSEFKIVLSYYYAYKAKSLAIKELHGTSNLSYHHLIQYINSINTTNPGSTTVLEGNPFTRKFERVFIGLEACSFGFKYCRPVIFVDATFMKGKTFGCLMSASAKDGNEGKY